MAENRVKVPDHISDQGRQADHRAILAYTACSEVTQLRRAAGQSAGKEQVAMGHVGLLEIIGFLLRSQSPAL